MMEIGSRVLIDIPFSALPVMGVLIEIEDGRYFIEDEQGNIIIERSTERIKKIKNS